MNAQITCISKDDRFNPYERIQRVGGLNPNGTRWAMTQQEAITWIAGGHNALWVAGQNGAPSVWVEISTSRFNNRYLKTSADGDEPNNLLSLPKCP